MRLHFRLDNKDHDGLHYIFLDVTHENKRLRVSTKIAIAKKHWNAHTERLHKTAPSAKEYNMALESIAIIANNVRARCITQGLPFELEMIRNEIRAPISPNAVVNLQTAFNEYLDSQAKNGSRAASLSIYRTMFQHVQAFEQSTGKTLSFASVDAAFFDSFLTYLRGKNFVDATVHKYIKGFKSFLMWCVEKRGIAVHPAYKHRMALRLKTESDHIALSQHELNMLEAYNTGSDTRLAKARDLFLVQCYTGLRYSDVKRLTMQHVKGTHIRIETVKTRQALTIPLHPAIIPILQRYDGKVPTLSNQRANEYLKEVCKRAGLTDSITRVEHRGAERTEIVQPKYECVGTHTGRRTFVTIALQNGISAEAIRKATGHKDLKSFDKYVKMTTEIVDHEFAKWHNGTQKNDD